VKWLSALRQAALPCVKLSVPSNKEGMISIKRGHNGGAFVADFDSALRALLNSLNTVVKLGQAKSSHLSEVRTILEPEITMLATLRAYG